MEKPKVFLSYAHTDERWAHEFADALREGRAEVVMASSRPAGSNWEDWLKRRMAESDYVVALVTPEAASSPWVLFELGAAFAIGKAIVAVVPKERDVVLPLVKTAQSVPRTTPRATARRLLEEQSLVWAA